MGRGLTCVWPAGSAKGEAVLAIVHADESLTMDLASLQRRDVGISPCRTSDVSKGCGSDGVGDGDGDDDSVDFLRYSSKPILIGGRVCSLDVPFIMSRDKMLYA